ncbi:ABC transporter transmembrane domain-containing protein [Shimia biformata]|uniref:ABC transporter transmembrane domain-containing protein n=1 Tax=Shimia biformata TaxID=1294299 RepID=UPI00194ED1E1|nr:ABC transporter ATP-binding protein [Shimia biformata]
MLKMYRAIWQVSGRRQLVLIALSIAIAALAAVPLEFQKQIINGLERQDMTFDHLIWLCASMAGAVVLSLGLKMQMGYRSSKLGEDVIRRIRNRLYRDAVHQPDDTEGAIPAGTLAASIASEAEELGNFAGSAFSQPVVQVGTLVSVVGYIAATQPGLGVIALATIIPQVVIVLLTQTKVNQHVAERVRLLRRSNDTIVESNLESLEQSVLADFDRIYETRRSMFLWKTSTKFLLSLVNQIGLIAVLLLGGAMVLRGATDVGTVVAATMGLGRLQGPTNFLIAFYRQVSATQVKYELLRSLRQNMEQPDSAKAEG